MATGISITHAFFTDQFPLCLMCLSPCISLLLLPARSFYKMLIFPLTCSFSISVPERRPAKTQQSADTVLVTDRPVCYSSKIVAIVELVVYLQRPLAQAKCPSVAYWYPKCYIRKALWSVLLWKNYHHNKSLKGPETSLGLAYRL